MQEEESRSDGSVDAEATVTVRPKKMKMSPRVVVTLLSPGTLSSLCSAPGAPTPAPRGTPGTSGEADAEARERTAPAPAPTPSPRRSVSPEMLAPAASPSEEEIEAVEREAEPSPPAEDFTSRFEKLLQKLEEMTVLWEKSEAENARLRHELNIYRTGVRTIEQLEDSVTGVRLGNQVTTKSKSGPSNRTIRRTKQRERAEARQSLGPAQHRLLEMQEQLRREIAGAQCEAQTRDGQGQRSQPLQPRNLPAPETSRQQEQSYRDALVSGWQVAGKRQKAQPSAATQQRQQPKPAAPSQRPAQVNRRARRRRPDAILVVPAPGVSFAEIYRPIRTSPALQEDQRHIRIGKRTPKGNLRMELARDVDAEALCRRIQFTLGELGSAKVLTEMAEVLLKNVDNLTEADTIREALRAALTREPTVASLRMWERADATKRARVRLPRVEAEAILSKKRLLIDYASCQLEEAPMLEAAKRRCFRCLERGHLAANCVGPDRSNCCIRCGEPGHRAATCSSAVSCIRCGGPHRIAAHGCRGPKR